MKRKVFLLCLLFMQLLGVGAFAASARTVKGVVVDETGEPLIGATVQVEGTSTGVTADLDGNFAINANDGQTLLISYVGYTPQKIKVTSGTNDVKVELKPNDEMLEDVVVIGYGSMKKKDLTGAITQINPDKIADSNPQTVQDLLRGTAGLQIGYDPSAKSNPSMELRGKNSVGTGSSPLIILDGMQFYGELSEINPDDIKQIDILKDSSSAAIYGAKAANGVIIVTTKKGNNSGKPSVSLSANWGFNTRSAYRRYMTADEYTQYRSDWYKRDTYAFDAEGNYGAYNIEKDGKRVTPLGYYDYPSQANLDKYGITLEEWMGQTANQSDDLRDIFGRRIDLNKEGALLDNFINDRTFDWYNDGFRTGVNQDYNVSLSGGTDRMNYYMSFGYMKNEGVVKGNDYNTIRASMRMSGKVTNWLEVGGNVNFQNRSDGDTTYPTSGDYWNANQLRFSPYALPYDPETGELNQYPMGGINRGNTWSNFVFNQQYEDFEKGYMVLNSKFYVNVTLPFGITYQFNVSPRYQYFWDRYFMSADLPNSNADDRGVNRGWGKWFDWSLNNTINWDYTFNDKHHVQLTLAQEAEDLRYWSDYIHARGITPTDALGFHYTQGGDKKISSFGTSDRHHSADALLARVFYAFDNRYMITASVRRDGYSAFGQNHPHATFPSVALAWNFANEKFMGSVADWWNTGKLRFSWGKNGNRDLRDSNGQPDPYRALADLTSGLGQTMNYLDANGNVTGDFKYLMMNRMANPNLEWEKTEAYNVGLDFGFLNNRISGSIDWYYKKTDGMIMAQRLPQFTGFSSITTNLGQVDNTGIELSLNSVNITNNVLEWTTNLTVSYNKNTIKHLYYEHDLVVNPDGTITDNGEKDDSGNNWFIGKPINTIWDYEVEGIWQIDEADQAALVGQKPGDPKVRNVYTDDDKILEDGTRVPVYNDNDKTFQGQTNPPVYLSMRNDFNLWKDFLISFSFYSYIGHKSRDGAYLNGDNGGDLITNGMNTYYKEYWTPENPSNTYGRLGAVGPTGATGVNRLLNRSFLRLADLTFGYTLPQKWTRKAAMEKVRFTFGIRNLFTISHKDWVYGDPETGGLGVRSFNLGVNVSF